MHRLAGAIAIVTGAGSGQGRAVAEAYAAQGAKVMVVDIDVESAEQTAKTIQGAGGTASFHRSDVSIESDWASTLGVTRQTFGGVDVLYNNAALFSPDDGPVTELSVEVWDRVQAVNVRSVFLGCKHAVPMMRERGGGSIINVASIRAHLGTLRAQDAYAASKGAVVALTRSLAIHLAVDRIRVNAISPGTILTPMAPLADEVVAAQRLARYPLGRFGETADITGAALYFASSDSLWTTGTELLVDGGTSAFYV